MKYRCPSCKMNWEDGTEPKERFCQPLCMFCSGRHNEKELLNWQMDHIKEINPPDLPVVIKHFYRYVERELSKLVGRPNDNPS